jgi:hypothetical protein
LTYDPDTQSLQNVEGKAVFQLDENDEWMRTLPEAIRDAVAEMENLFGGQVSYETVEDGYRVEAESGAYVIVREDGSMVVEVAGETIGGEEMEEQADWVIEELGECEAWGKIAFLPEKEEGKGREYVRWNKERGAWERLAFSGADEWWLKLSLEGFLEEFGYESMEEAMEGFVPRLTGESRLDYGSIVKPDGSRYLTGISSINISRSLDDDRAWWIALREGDEFEFAGVEHVARANEKVLVAKVFEPNIFRILHFNNKSNPELRSVIPIVVGLQTEDSWMQNLTYIQDFQTNELIGEFDSAEKVMIFFDDVSGVESFLVGILLGWYDGVDSMNLLDRQRFLMNEDLMWLVDDSHVENFSNPESGVWASWDQFQKETYSGSKPASLLFLKRELKLRDGVGLFVQSFKIDLSSRISD